MRVPRVDQNSGSLSLGVCLSHASFQGHNPPKLQSAGYIEVSLILSHAYLTTSSQTDKGSVPSLLPVHQMPRGTKGQPHRPRSAK